LEKHLCDGRQDKKRLDAHEGDFGNTLTEMVHRVKWDQPLREIHHGWPFHFPHNLEMLGGQRQHG
jgi:hypothetical protein